MSENYSSGSTDEQDSSSTTTSTATRHRFTNDILALMLVAATVGLAVAYAIGVASTTEIPRAISDVLALGTLAALAWAFGPETIAEAAKAFKGKK